MYIEAQVFSIVGNIFSIEWVQINTWALVYGNLLFTWLGEQAKMVIHSYKKQWSLEAPI